MSQEMELESAVIRRFIVKNRRDRYLSFVSNPKNRGGFVGGLMHFSDFDISKFEEVKGNNIVIEDTIKQRIGKEKECYVISENAMIDCKRMAFELALAEIVGRGMATLLVFGDAKFVYYEGEGKNNRWISK